MQILEVKNLYKSFGGLMAIRNLSLTIHEAEIVGLIGPNGSGKTTLFNLISGFLKPDQGSIIFEGKDITGAKAHRICQMGIARTFQIVKSFSKLTALENIMVARLYGSKPVREIRQANMEAESILRFIGFQNTDEMTIEDFGIVDRKRLELGRELATRPKLLLVDEMMAGLNPVEIESTMSLLKTIRDSGITLVIVEHVMKAVLGISDRLIVLNAGEKIADGPPKQVISNQLVIKAYLGLEQNA